MKEHKNAPYHVKAPKELSPLEAIAALEAIHKLENIAKGAEQLKALRKKLNPGFELADE